MMNIRVVDHSGEVIEQMNAQLAAALEEIGLRAEGYAKMKCPVGTAESTGVQGYRSSGLKQSITHKVVGTDVYIGTNKNIMINGKRVYYSVYVELGTGIRADDNKGRKTPWVWVDKNGKPHKTQGMKPRHFLRDAASQHTAEYKKTIEKYLKGQG